MSHPVVRLKYLCSVSGEYGLNVSADRYVADGVRLIRTTDIGENGQLTPRTAGVFIPPDEAESLLLEDGDLLFSRSGTLGRSLLYQSDGDGQCSFAAYLVRFRSGPDSDPRFIRYWSESQDFADQIAADAVQSTIANFNAEKFSNLLVPRWSPAEQKQIVELLDAETTRIDAVVEHRKRMLALLEERDLALSHDMITGGTSSDERVTSRLPWLGDLPASWAIAPVGTQFHVQLGRMLNAERAANGDMRPYIKNINVRWDRCDTADLAEMDFPPEEREKYLLRPGDLLINEGGAGIGRSAVWDGQIEECYFQKSVLRLRPLKDANPLWMLECMRVATAQKVFLVEGNLATIPHVPAEALRAHRFPFPPRAVQDCLLERLNEQRSVVAALRTRLEQQVDRLREHRQALITETVTGDRGRSRSAA